MGDPEHRRIWKCLMVRQAKSPEGFPITPAALSEEVARTRLGVQTYRGGALAGVHWKLSLEGLVKAYLWRLMSCLRSDGLICRSFP